MEASDHGDLVDAIWPGDEEDDNTHAVFAATVTQTLLKKDFCVTQMVLAEEVMSEAGKEAASSHLKFQVLKKELQTTYLGRDAQAKVHWMKADDGETNPETALEECDLFMSTMSQLLQPLTLAAFEFEAGCRTGSMVRKPFSSAAEAAKLRPLPIDEDDVEDGLVDSHIMFCRRRKLCMMSIIDGDGGILNFFPSDASREKISLNVGNGQMIIFRHDRLSYSYTPSSSNDLVLQSWLMTKPIGLAAGTILGMGAAKDALLGMVKGPGTPSGHQINVSAVRSGLPANCHGQLDRWWAAVVGGMDGYTRVPRQRFDITPYYRDYPSGEWELGYTYACHAGFVEDDIYSLDNEFFGISKEEAVIISPVTKQLLHNGYATLHDAGERKSSRLKIGLYGAHSGDDWSFSPSFTTGSEDCHRCGLNSRTWHCQFARVQYELGLTGPCLVADTACSSALITYNLAHTTLRKAEGSQQDSCMGSGLNAAMIMSGNMIPGHQWFLYLSGPHMLSAQGRCFTFNASADGFARSEGTGVIYAKAVEKYSDDSICCMIGAYMNQDGRSASMTAPNGPSQQDCIRGSMKEARLDPNDVICAECHGTGTALGDPIEVGALKGVMRKRVVPLIETSAKAHTGHAENTAGMKGMLKCIAMGSAGAGSPSPHLTFLNPNLDVTGYPTLFCTELVNYEANASVSGVSSFGWGGANGRVDVWASCKKGANKICHPKDVDLKLLDYISVTCPIDCGPMHFINGKAIPESSGKLQKGPYRADAIRDEFDAYDCSSNAYRGEYRLNMQEIDESVEPPAEAIYISGSWSQWRMDEMINENVGEYTYSVLLGHTRYEQFHIVVGEKALQRIYPVVNGGGMRTRVIGPDSRGEGKHWLIDGRDAEVPAGTVYNVTLKWGSCLSVTWEKTDVVGDLGCIDEARHRYQVCGSFTSSANREMTPVRDAPNAFQMKFKMGPSGWERFHFLRDNDESQLIYPLQNMAHLSSVPVRGPDPFGKGKHFCFRCSPHDEVNLTVTLVDGHVRVEARSSSVATVWESMDGPKRHSYAIFGSLTDKAFGLPMEPDPERCNIFRHRGTTGLNSREWFFIVMDNDENNAYYPQNASDRPGKTLTVGPAPIGDYSEQRGWSFDCWKSGVEYEIVIDLDAEDMRKKVVLNWLTDPVDFATMTHIVATALANLDE